VDGSEGVSVVGNTVHQAGGAAISFGDSQIRLAHDGRWWPFTKHAGRWQLAGRPSQGPEDLVDPQ